MVTPALLLHMKDWMAGFEGKQPGMKGLTGDHYCCNTLSTQCCLYHTNIHTHWPKLIVITHTYIDTDYNTHTHTHTHVFIKCPSIILAPNPYIRTFITLRWPLPYREHWSLGMLLVLIVFFVMMGHIVEFETVTAFPMRSMALATAYLSILRNYSF